jgi:hypothetical protein
VDDLEWDDRLDENSMGVVEFVDAEGAVDDVHAVGVVDVVSVVGVVEIAKDRLTMLVIDSSKGTISSTLAHKNRLLQSRGKFIQSFSSYASASLKYSVSAGRSTSRYISTPSLVPNSCTSPLSNASLITARVATLF